jgi:hypothetical protein
MTVEATNEAAQAAPSQAIGAAALAGSDAAAKPGNGAAENGAAGKGLESPPAAGEAVAEWLQGMAPELQALAKAKGWKGPADLAASYQSLEKVYGAEKAGRTVLALPKDDAPAEEWAAVWAKLGRPEDAAGYKLAEGDGVDAAFAEWAGGTFLEAGLTTKQAEVLKTKWNALQGSMVEAEDKQFMEQAKSEFGALKTEWGGQFDAKLELGKRFAAKAGFSEGELGAIERVLGTRTLLERFAEMGARLGEDTMPADAQGASGLPGQGDALAEIAALIGDKAFQAARLRGDREAREKWDRLHQAAYPDSKA